MAAKNQSRRTWGIAICIILGLILGEFIKRVTLGLAIGLGLGLLATSLYAGRKK
jgi:hypothetical protein